MKNKTKNRRFTVSVKAQFLARTGFLALLVCLNSCKKFVGVDAPVTNLNAANIYQYDATAAAVMTGIYTTMSTSEIALSGIPGISYFAALSADDLYVINGYSNQDIVTFYKNSLNSSTGTNYWSILYPVIYTTNSAIEGLSASNSLTPAVKQQLTGEAKFMRAFCYFYLVNFYGDVPLITTTNYQINGSLSRTPQTQVYQQIVQDLLDAESLLSDKYLQADALTSYAPGSEQRVRPTKWAAYSLLARVYLYMGAGHYVDAETQASTVINNAAEFNLVSLDNAFLKNNQEAIWQLQPVSSGTQSNTGEGFLFILPTSGPNVNQYPVWLNNNLISSFESGDLRKMHWVNSVTVSGNTYYYAFKYKVGALATATSEYPVIFRLAEQYLIRAEARAMQGKLTGGNSAASDLNVIRIRAGLPNTTAMTQADFSTAILHERQVELFTEWGHRWLDLKRTGNVNGVMGVVTPKKGGTWNPKWQYYPLPLTDIQRDINLVQNSGY